MRLLTSILFTGMLFTLSGAPGHSLSSPTLQSSSVTSQPSFSSPHLIVKGGHPGHRGSGRLESYPGMVRSLG